jgi:glycosyltransferase involved in cell wall biosynthesis
LTYWLLTTEYPPDHGGGISTYCYFTARMLAEAGHQVTVFTNDESIDDFILGEESKNIRLLRFNSNREEFHKFLGYTARLSYAFAGVVRKMIGEEGKPDFIEAQDYLGIAYYLTQFKHTGYAWLSGVPILITLHSPAFIYLRYNRVPLYRFPDYWTGEMEKQAIKAADAIISPTRFMLEEVKKDISFDGIPVSVIANPFKASYGISHGFTRNKIVYYGKLSAQKGSFELLAYFKALWDEGFPHALHIIGGTDIVYHPEMKTMGQLVKEKYALYLEKGLLQLHGKIEPSHIQQQLQDAHLIIVPSTIDNMPYVVMEAMSLGKIVLASIQGGQSEMMEEGISGFLFDHRHPSTFSQQLKKILALGDEDVQRLGANAAQRITEYYGFDPVRAEKSAFLSELKAIKRAENEFPFLYQEQTMPVAETVSAPDILSVVIPYYNMGNYIEECVRSVLNSTYVQIELIIINDGSNDASSLDKLEKLKSQKNIAIINRPNLGLAAARNFGAESAKGEFLAFLDADDKIAPDYYEKAVLALKRNNNVFFAGSWVQYFENSHHAWACFTPQPPYALVHNPVNSSGLVYKRNAFLAGGRNDKDADYGMEDYESLVSMMRNGFNGVILPELLFYYRVRSGSMFRNITREKLLYSNAYISEKHKDFYAKFATQIINLLNANGPGYLYDNPTFETRVSIKSGGESKLFFKLKNFIKKNERLKRAALYLLKTKTDL